MIEIICRHKSLPAHDARLAAAARRVYAGENIPDGQMTTLVICSDYAIRKLNSRYRGKDKATDVLSFRFGDPDLLGEVYISAQRAKAQAKAYGLTYNEELERLLIHGLLHLTGYDHIKKSDKEIMEARERVYAAAPTQTAS